MPHIVLLGDSIFDNAAYTAGGPSVIQQLSEQLPAPWRATLNAIDGATTQDIPEQLQRLPADATHLVLSVGGNDALLQVGVLELPVSDSTAALLNLYALAREFAASYEATVEQCLIARLPLVVCTIYNGLFPDADLQRRNEVALAVLNDVILRTALQRQLTVIELRAICVGEQDYANPIEPSSSGGAKIAAAIVRAVTGTERGMRLVT